MSEIQISAELKSHFLRLYQIALADGDFSSLELKMLYDFAEERGILKEHLDEILLNPRNLNELVPENVIDKLEYLCDFTTMIWADGLVSPDEKISLQKYIRLFGFLEENVVALSDFLITAVKEGKNKKTIINELND
jgi:DnaJ-domain-containing protein 1